MSRNPERYFIGDEDVNGILIGEIVLESYYEFWTECAEPRCIASTHAASDAEAIEWFRTTSPRAFAAGAEMRVRN